MELIRIAANTDAIQPAFTKLVSVTVTAADGVDATVDVYDSPTVTGTSKVKLKAVLKTSESVVFPKGVPFKNGMSVAVTGAGTVAYIGVE